MLKKLNQKTKRAIFLIWIASVFTLVCLALFILYPYINIYPLTVFFSQQRQQTQQHAAGISNHVAVGISPGFGFEELFGKMSSSQQQTVINQMKSNGVKWLRLDYYPNDSFNYQFIKNAEAAGIDVDVLLENFSTIPAEFASFSTQAVRTLKPLGVHTYEILNEVNIHTPQITAAQYVSLLKAVYTTIKTDDPSSTVLMSGLGTGSGNQGPYTYLQAMYDSGAKGYFDAANIHPYSFPNMPAPPVASQCQNYNSFCYDLPAMHAVMQKNGDGNKKIWITEFGCPTGRDAGQPAACTDATLAQQITQAFNQANAWGWTGPLFVFNWQDNRGDGDFGLYDATGSPKTAALAAFMQIAAASAIGATLTPIVTPSPTPTMPISPSPSPTEPFPFTALGHLDRASIGCQ